MVDCWYEERYGAMLEAAKRRSLLSTHAGQVLKELIDLADTDSLIELGCGTGQASELINGYFGVDLPHIIENVTKESDVDGEYWGVDVINGSLDFLEEYDLVLMSAFIDVMQEPILVLRKVLNKCNKYVIIHRQELSLYPTIISKEPSYGGYTYHSKINEKEFSDAIRGFEVVERISCKYDNWEGGGASLLLKRT